MHVNPDKRARIEFEQSNKEADCKLLEKFKSSDKIKVVENRTKYINN